MASGSVSTHTHTQSDEHNIGTNEGVIRTRDIKRLPRSERYHIDYLRSVVGIPWQPRGQDSEYPFFVFPSPLMDAPSVLHGPLPRRDHTTNDQDGTTSERGGLRRARAGDSDVEPLTTCRRATSPIPPATIRSAEDDHPGAPSSTRLRVAHLRHGLLPVTGVVSKKGMRVQKATPD